ncbi:MAG: hypothetical protein ACI93R_004289 [Flavobacteriales bacterium]|jgi:hypothetical protein
MLISLTLRYLGESLDPEVITSTLGVSPTECRVKGEKVVSPRGKVRIIKKGYWEWSVKNDCSDLPEKIDESVIQLDKLVADFDAIFHDVIGLLNTPLNCEHSWIDIHIVSDETGASVSFPLSNKSMSILGKTGLLVDFTITK